MNRSSFSCSIALAAAGLAVLTACGGTSSPRLGANSTCKTFMSAVEADQDRAVNEVATAINAPAAVGPLGRPAVNVYCASHPAATVKSAVASVGGVATAPSAEPSATLLDQSLDRDGATAAATRALMAMLGYDYRSLDEDLARAQALMTAAYARTYADSFQTIRSGAGTARVVVTASVRDIGVSGISKDAASVLAFVDQNSTSGSGPSRVMNDSVQVSLTKEGGRWLVDDLKNGGGAFAVEEPDTRRARAQDAARRFAHDFLTYTPASFDSAMAAVESRLTDRYRTTFEDMLQTMKQTVATQKATSSADISSTAVKSASGDRMTVLVVCNQQTSAGNGATERVNRLELNLLDEGGTWAVDDMNLVS